MKICSKCGRVETGNVHTCVEIPIITPGKTNLEKLRSVASAAWLIAADTRKKLDYRRAGETYLELGRLEEESERKAKAFEYAAVMFQAAVDFDDEPEA